MSKAEELARWVIDKRYKSVFSQVSDNEMYNEIYTKVKLIENSRQSEIDELTKERDDWKKECGLRLIELTKMEINCKLKKTKLTDELKKLKAEVERLKINNNKLLIDFFKHINKNERLDYKERGIKIYVEDYINLTNKTNNK